MATAPRRSRAGLVIHATRRPPPVERMCAEALVRGLVTSAELQAARIIDPDRAAPTRSQLERHMLALIRRAGLPRPLVNHTIGPYEIDFVWPKQRVLIETDGWNAHGHRFAFERDWAQDADLVAQGWVVLRFTWRQVLHQPFLVATRVAQALALRAAAA